MVKKTAIVIGATGLVGSEIVKLLITNNSYELIRVFTRRSIEETSPRIEEHIVDFEKIEEWKHEIIGDVLFSAMGTTIRQAGSKKGQYKIDFTYQYEVADEAAKNGVKQLLLVSSMGANPKSKIFYSRIKGELEVAVQKLQFKNVYIIRPSGLIGKREIDRAGEKTMIRLTSAIVSALPFLKKYKPINALTVAQAMINISANAEKNQDVIIDNDRLFDLAKSK